MLSTSPRQATLAVTSVACAAACARGTRASVLVVGGQWAPGVLGETDAAKSMLAGVVQDWAHYCVL